MSSAQNAAHVTVLLAAAVDALAVKADGVYADATFGRGGHSRAILAQLGEKGRLLALDRDPAAIEAGRAIQFAFPAYPPTLRRIGRGRPGGGAGGAGWGAV